MKKLFSLLLIAFCSTIYGQNGFDPYDWNVDIEEWRKKNIIRGFLNANIISEYQILFDKNSSDTNLILQFIYDSNYRIIQKRHDFRSNNTIYDYENYHYYDNWDSTSKRSYTCSVIYSVHISNLSSIISETNYYGEYGNLERTEKKFLKETIKIDYFYEYFTYKNDTYKNYRIAEIIIYKDDCIFKKLLFRYQKAP